MLVRRVLRLGNSLGVTLPAKDLAAIGIKEGTPVEVQVDAIHGRIVLRPLPPAAEVDPRFIEEARVFADRYRYVLEELARR